MPFAPTSWTRTLYAAWFVRRVAQYTARLGTPLKEQPIETLRNGVLRQTLAIRDEAGRGIVAVYFGGVGTTDRFEVYRIVSSHREVMDAYVDTAVKIMRSWPSRAADGTREERESREDRGSRKDRQAAYRTAPGAGIRPSEIEMFAAERRMSVAPLTLTVSPTYVPVMLLKNGEYCESIDLPPGDMNVAAHKQAHPHRWGKWRRRGKKFERFVEKKGWTAVNWEQRLYPARKGDELRGAFRRITSTAAARTSIVSDRTLTFLPGGRFSDGKTTTLIAPYPGASGSRKRQPKLGTYRLDGSAIELHYPDGTVQRRAFLWAGTTKKSIYLDDELWAIF